MATINRNKIKIIKRWYQSGFSAREISEKLNVSIDAVYYFFRKHSIPRRSFKENNILQFKKKKPSFKLKNKLSIKESELKIAGAMLYWGEGSKWKGETVVDFANSDADMIKVFLMFLRNVCGVDEKKLRAYLYCYANQEPDKLIKFWSGLTKITKNQFTKPYVRKDFNPQKANKMKYGLIHIRYADKKLYLLIKKWINEFVNNH